MRNRHLTDEELLQEAQELDSAHARADAVDAAQSSRPTRTVPRILWDNGAHACGTFPEDYPSEEAAQDAADAWAAECNARDGLDPASESAYTAEVVWVEELDPSDDRLDSAAEMQQLERAALNRGQP